MKIEKIKDKCFLKFREEIKKNKRNKKSLKFLNKLLKAITEVQIVMQEELKEV